MRYILFKTCSLLILRDDLITRGLVIKWINKTFDATLEDNYFFHYLPRQPRKCKD